MWILSAKKSIGLWSTVLLHAIFTPWLIHKHQDSKWLWVLFSLLQSLGNLIETEQEIWKSIMYFPRSWKDCETHWALSFLREWALTGQDSSFPVMLWEYSGNNGGCGNCSPVVRFQLGPKSSAGMGHLTGFSSPLAPNIHSASCTQSPIKGHK
jgi:hypothetical protein